MTKKKKITIYISKLDKTQMIGNILFFYCRKTEKIPINSFLLYLESNTQLYKHKQKHTKQLDATEWICFLWFFFKTKKQMAWMKQHLKWFEVFFLLVNYFARTFSQSISSFWYYRRLLCCVGSCVQSFFFVQLHTVKNASNEQRSAHTK